MMGFASRYPFFARLDISYQIYTSDFEEDTIITSKIFSEKNSQIIAADGGDVFMVCHLMIRG